MMTEVELKAAVRAEQLPIIADKLAALGFSKGPLRRECDAYFNAPDRDFRKTDEALRLRSVNGQTLLTYKGAKCDARSSTRTELETGVQCGETAHAILQALGYKAVFCVDKSRCMYTRENITVCLDDIRGLGCFLELETLLENESGRDAAVDALLALLQSLGLARSALTRKSYLELLMASATE